MTQRLQHFFSQLWSARFSRSRRHWLQGGLVIFTAASVAILGSCAQSPSSPSATAPPPEVVRLDYAYYNPVSLVLKEQGWLEADLAADNVRVEWVQSQGSNKALELLNSRSIDFGSTAGAAALLGKANGNPIQAIYVYSKPEWTALVTRPDTGITQVADLKGKKIAVTRGTDPHIFLLRALDQVGLTESDVTLVQLQHADGRTALERGDVDAWAGLDPHMAKTELEQGSQLFFRNPDLNTYGILNVREEFAAAHPAYVERVLAAYEKARLWALDHPADLERILATAASLDQTVAAKQLERTDLSNSVIGTPHQEAIAAAGDVLKKSGVVPADTDIPAVVEALIEPQFIEKVATR